MFLSVIKNNSISDSYLPLSFPKESQSLNGHLKVVIKDIIERGMGEGDTA